MAKQKAKRTVDRYAGNENCPIELAKLMALAGRAGLDAIDVATILGFTRTMLYFIISGTQGGSPLVWKKIETLTGLLVEKCESGALPILFNKPDRHARYTGVIEALTAKITRVKLDTAETGIKPIAVKAKASKPAIKPIKAEKVKKVVKAAKATVPTVPAVAPTKPAIESKTEKATAPKAKAVKKASKPNSAPKPAVSSSVASLIASANEL